MKYYQFEHSFLSRQALIEFETKRNTITIKKESKNPWKRTRYHLMEINGEKEFKGKLPLNLKLTPNDYAIYFAREVWFRPGVRSRSKNFRLRLRLRLRTF